MGEMWEHEFGSAMSSTHNLPNKNSGELIHNFSATTASAVTIVIAGVYQSEVVVLALVVPPGNKNSKNTVFLGRGEREAMIHWFSLTGTVMTLVV